jgi:hypothetical protein
MEDEMSYEPLEFLKTENTEGVMGVIKKLKRNIKLKHELRYNRLLFKVLNIARNISFLIHRCHSDDYQELAALVFLNMVACILLKYQNIFPQVKAR